MLSQATGKKLLRQILTSTTTVSLVEELGAWFPIAQFEPQRFRTMKSEDATT